MIIHEILDHYFDVTTILYISTVYAQDMTLTFESTDFSQFSVVLKETSQEIWITGRKQEVVDGRKELIEVWRAWR